MKRSVTPSLLESPLVTFMSAHTHPAELAKARTKSVAVVRKISTRLPEQRGPGAGGDDDSEGANDEPRPFGGPGFDYESFGGAEGIRTPDPLDANEVRYRTAPQPPGNRRRITAGVSRSESAKANQSPTARRCSGRSPAWSARRSGAVGAFGRAMEPAGSRRPDVHAPGWVRSILRVACGGATAFVTYVGSGTA